MRYLWLASALTWLTGCGNEWQPGSAPHTRAFPLLCAHETAACEDCHPAAEPIRALDPACASCHLEDRPVSHDPATTGTCDDCHADDACGWDSASPHPPGFSEPADHGIEAKLGGPTEGACVDCHGADLTGGATPTGATARGCDACHTEQGHADWRTDCTFCHGGELDPSGAPPVDIDGTDGDAAFGVHAEHVGVDSSYRALGCAECHVDHNDAMSPGHWFDGTPGEAESAFDAGIAPRTTWNAADHSCANDYCHGQGQRDDGSAALGDPPIDEDSCDTCHASSEPGWTKMSGLHATHLESSEGGAIVCNDCHGAVIDRQGRIGTPARHVDGQRDVAFYETAITTGDNGGTCQGVCHGTNHDPATMGWGHVPDYDLPELHGVDSNLQALSCRSCHGQSWDGGVAQNCDDCHTTEGHADWRTDCTFCHGGTNGDQDGLPPQDIDGETVLANISFPDHPSHHGASPVNGHPSYDCTQCHTKPTDAMSAGHAIDGSPAYGEVDFAAGWSAEGAYDRATKSCDNLYCHGNGQAPSGVIAMATPALDCDACHATTTGWSAMSGTHDPHLRDPTISCADCHSDVVDANGNITDDDLHVNRQKDLSADAGWNGSTCTNNCHGVSHDGMPWAGAHPDGYDDPLQHGQEALLRLQNCATSSCHGASLQGATGDACDDCHATNGHADWRSDCVYCHGGTTGDTAGAPPADIDNTTALNQVTFRAHRAHLDNDIHPAWTCATCHPGAGAYDDAPTDAGHWLVDSTPTVAEVDFSGVAAAGIYAAGSCSANYCHGNGQENGSVADGPGPLDCDDCHSYAFVWTDLSGTHARHLGVSGIACTDCHSGVVDRSGTITSPNKHVDGAVGVTTATAGFTIAPPGTGGQYTCNGTCHQANHTAWPWNGGHPPGYDAPEVHGQEALFQVQECRDCHGYDANGGTSGQGCDTCHTAGWRADCTFCHGGANGDVDGVPPSDLDDNVNEATITFMAHPEHVASGDHPNWDCTICHDAGSYVDAWDDVGHWWDDGSIGVAEVDMSGSLAPASVWNTTTNQCTNNYCHSAGKSTSLGTVTDSNNGLSCTSCHGNPPSTGDHNKHDNYPCSDCHSDIASTGAFTSPTQHVNGLREVADGSGTAITFSWNGTRWTCNGTCHDSHGNETW